MKIIGHAHNPEERPSSRTFLGMLVGVFALWFLVTIVAMVFFHAIGFR